MSEREQELTNALQRIYDWSRDGTLGPETFKRAARLEARAALVPAEKPPRAEGAWGKPYADAMRFVPEGDERCDEPMDACRCMKRKGHDGNHACAHGYWRVGGDGAQGSPDPGSFGGHPYSQTERMARRAVPGSQEPRDA